MTVRGSEHADPDAGLSSAAIAALAGQLRQLAVEGRGIPHLPAPILAALRDLAPSWSWSFALSTRRGPYC